jgi:hypothetical protein
MLIEHRIWEDIGECGRAEENVGGHRRVWEEIGECGRA